MPQQQPPRHPAPGPRVPREHEMSRAADQQHPLGNQHIRGDPGHCGTPMASRPATIIGTLTAIDHPTESLAGLIGGVGITAPSQISCIFPRAGSRRSQLLPAPIGLSGSSLAGGVDVFHAFAADHSRRKSASHLFFKGRIRGTNSRDVLVAHNELPPSSS
jgi:hypothetical protein